VSCILSQTAKKVEDYRSYKTVIGGVQGKLAKTCGVSEDFIQYCMIPVIHTTTYEWRHTSSAFMENFKLPSNRYSPLQVLINASYARVIRLTQIKRRSTDIIGADFKNGWNTYPPATLPGNATTCMTNNNIA
jgi:hypothetical protein